jgi:hypothetical protein
MESVRAEWTSLLLLVAIDNQMCVIMHQFKDLWQEHLHSTSFIVGKKSLALDSALV